MALDDDNYVVICARNHNDTVMLRLLLAENKYDVVVTTTAAQFVECIGRRRPDVAIIDGALDDDSLRTICGVRVGDSFYASMQMLAVVSMFDVAKESMLLRMGFDDVIAYPYHANHVLLRVANAVRRCRYSDEQDMFEKTLFALSSAIDARTTNNAGHPERVADMSRRLGKRVGMSLAEQDILYKGGMLHDIGMVKIPAAILDKTGVLSSEEYDLIKTHTIWGERLCRPLITLDKVLPLIRYHHEQMDGSGYPDGLKGDAIPEMARIVGICEVYDALSRDRPYRARLPMSQALAYLNEYAGRHWLDGKLVREFVTMIEQGGESVSEL